MHSFYTAAGARVPTVPVSLPAQAAAPVQPAPRPSFTEERSRVAGPLPGTQRRVQRRVVGSVEREAWFLKIPWFLLLRRESDFSK